MLPGHVQLGLLFLIVSTLGVGLGIVFDEQHREHPYEHRFRWHNRVLLAAAPLLAAAVDLGVAAPDPVLGDALTALLAGSVLLSVFGEKLTDHAKVDFRYFLAGAVMYIALFFIQVDVL